MARYEGRHRPSASAATRPTPAVPSAPMPPVATSVDTSSAGTAEQLYAQLDAPPALPDAPRRTYAVTTRAEARRLAAQSAAKPTSNAPSPWLRRPVLAGGVVVALGSSALAYADTMQAPPATSSTFVVGDLVAADLSEQAVADSVAEREQAGASASRNEQRAAVADAAARAKAAAEAKARAAAEAAKAKAAAEAKAKADYEKVVANAKANPQAVARELIKPYGWGEGEFSCLVTLWNGESDWRWWADNPTSAAYGIPQSLPASKMAKFGDDYMTNPVTQIKWGLWYIDASYGTPCAALDFWNNRLPHWY